MARIEKTIFISYRRTDVYTALAVYENLKNQGYDVFFDYRSISSGDFEQIITANIRARAHFLLILTSTALDRCNEPGDWLRREIELAIDEKRNIVPLFFKGFCFGIPSVSERLTGKLKNLSRYNGLNVHEDYFDEAMHRLSVQYLKIPLDTVLHPVSTDVLKVVKAEQVAADKALEQIEDAKDLVKQSDENPIQLPEPDPMPDFKPAESITSHDEELETKPETARKKEHADPEPALKKKEERASIPLKLPATKITLPNLNSRLIGGIAGGVILVSLFIWGIPGLLKKQPLATVEPTRTSLSTTMTSQPTKTLEPTIVVIPSITATFLPPITGKDGMTLLYVPAGEFTMGRKTGDGDDEPVHTVYLDAFWIDKTEVTNVMYAKCVGAGVCDSPDRTDSNSHDSYYGNTEFNDHPVIYVDWNMAKTYCEWADRRLPTEAEWEKAARGENAFIYPWGNFESNNSLLNYNNAAGDTTKVGIYPNGASPYGALDMAGNVWEWVEDWYDAYPGNFVSNSDYGTKYRVERGGAWNSSIDGVRSANRIRNVPSGSSSSTGFRCAVSQSDQSQSTSTSSSPNSIGLLFQSKCTSCHGAAASAGLSLLTYVDIIKGGNSGAVVIPGNSAGSLLVTILQTSEHPGELTPEELTQVIEWIDSGAPGF